MEETNAGELHDEAIVQDSIVVIISESVLVLFVHSLECFSSPLPPLISS